ncbi:uncharacterized protein LOC107883942 isoform X2 [Acyrthosiphon pisum]|uniref:DUF4806 domain-containing protein n=1 Tax=Acyrthosiphon pisum TaxID=7029 RepID=A0A8R2H9L9_ACYPI|nr:uncharacterized protein LOC107883942 isoform X2 [Acyrthosiphon pisum]|eukprot:XP_016660506.1 PREDICTED: uncharacterized protein LOC107883942 isoform X2 [Acyrthosiphon pisum]
MNTPSSKKSSFRKKWVLAVFPESKDYSVIPINWLVDKEKLAEGAIKFCRWPLTRVTSNELKDAVDPEPLWETYRVKVVGRSKTYDNFSKAWHQKFIEESSATENEEITKKKEKKSYDSDSDESNNEGNSGFYIEEKSKSPCVDLQTVNSCPSVYNMLLPMLPSNILTQIDDYSENVEATTTNSSMTHSNTTVSELQPSINTSHFPMTTSSYTHGFDDLNPKLIEVLNNLYRENIATNLMLNRVMVKVEGIEANLKNKNLNTDSTIYLDTQFLTLFPINSTNEFNLIENQIQNSSDFVSKLESFLKSIGGTNPKNHLNRVLVKVFTNEFGIKCSWTGRGQKIEMKIGDSHLIKIIKKVIKDVSTSLFTESDFDKTASDWLRHANTRHNRTLNI